MDALQPLNDVFPVPFQERVFKVLIVGDSHCGKTRIIQTYLQSIVPTTNHDQLSTRYEYYKEGFRAKFSLLDVRGIEDVAKASTRFDFPDVALFFYAVNDFKSFFKLQSLWIPTFRMTCGYDVPMILVGNKIDLRTSNASRSVVLRQENTLSYFDGVKAKTNLGLDMFIECSAEDYESIDRLFQAAYSYVV